MEIANIISKDQMDLGPEFKIYQSFDDIINPHLPTLIVGCDLTKQLFGDDLNFLERKIDNNLFWTFTKKELRKKYFNDLEDFIQYSYECSVHKLSYIYLDIIQYDSVKIRKIIKKMLSLKEIYTFYIENMIYMYSDKFIFGVDLDLLKYSNVDKLKVLNKIKVISKVFLEGNEILIEYKNYMERLENKVRFIPFIYSISNNE